MAFTPRLTDNGMNGNPYWYSLNPFYNAPTTPSHLYGLPNCTCYAWGRRYEITGKAPDTSLGNARYWYEYAVQNGQRVGQTPQLGAIACFTDTREGYAGHVGIVEQINGTTVTLSNSNFGTDYFVVWTVDYILRYNPTFLLQGYIYLDSDPIPPQPYKSSMPFIYYLKPLWKRGVL